MKEPALSHDIVPMQSSIPEYQQLLTTRDENREDNGIKCFLMDVQTRVFNEIKQSGLELYVKSFDGYYYKFYIAHDPYFYVLLDDWKKERGFARMMQRKCINKWGSPVIKSVEKEYYHAWGVFNDIFINKTPALKITTFFPNDIVKCRKIVEKVKGAIHREADVPYHHRVVMDLDLNIGRAYNFKIKQGFVHVYKLLKNVKRLPVIPEKCTFDIEIKKQPIKKPMVGDPINMFGYKYVSDGYMINNVAIHKVDIEGFWLGVKKGKIAVLTKEEAEKQKKTAKYKPVYFYPINVENETAVISYWKQFLENEKPKVVGGYNSDKFDWKQIVENGKMQEPPVTFDDMLDYDKYERAWKKDGYIFLDVIRYIERDSYLSKGNRGLKDVSKIKLGIEPLEIDHEETVSILSMIENRWGNPNSPEYDIERCKREVQALAYYCASDVFITSILLEKHVTDLDVSLSTIIPMTVFESARKRRGPMIEAMLLKRMHENGMIAPNKVTFHGKASVNPAKEIKKKKTVFQEYTKNEKNYWARCVEKKWIKEHCKGCDDLSKCKKAFVNPIYNNKRFRCSKTGEVLVLTPDADLPVERYKFEGAYVDVFNIGVFKDNCPIKVKIDMDDLSRVENKMKAVVLRQATALRKEGFEVDIHEYFSMIKSGFDKVRKKCKKIEGTDKMEYFGLIVIVHIDVASMYPNIIIHYNLQPHGVVNDIICDSCPWMHDEGEPCCWVELPWNAVYDVLMIPPGIKSEIEEELENVPMESRFKMYKKGLKVAIKEKRVKKLKKMNYSFKMPETARFCQKAHKFFVEMVKEFRDERYNYKYGEKDTWMEIESKRAEWYEKMPDERRREIESMQGTIRQLEQAIERHLTLDTIIKEEFNRIITKSKELRSRERVIEEEWMAKIPDGIREKIESLEIKAVYNHNAQLTYKVILNAIYGWLKSAGARLWSIEVTGCTTLAGQNVIIWVTEYVDGWGVPIELDSLDYTERLIFKDPNGLIRVKSIGEFVDECFDANNVERIDSRRKVEYAKSPDNWEVLSVDEKGNVEWQRVKRGIRQETDRDLTKIKTPFGKVKVTDSHSIFHNNVGMIEPVEVKNVENDFITHACYIPPVEQEFMVTLVEPIENCDMFVFVPRNDENSRWSRYPVSKLRPTKYSTGRESYYKIPCSEFDGKVSNGYLVGGLKGAKFDAIIPMTEDLAELCGWYVLEGRSVNRDRGNWTALDVEIAQKKGKNLDHIMELVASIGGHVRNYVPKATLSDKRTGTYRVGMSNTFFYQLFKVLGCGKTSLEKRIPPMILSSPVNIKRAFLRGYFKGDGSRQGKRLAFYTASDGLRDDLFVLGKQLGYIVSCFDSPSPTSGALNYCINYMTRKNWKRGSRSRYQYNEIGKTIGLQVKGKERVRKFNNYVYDISVEKNDNFVSANGGILLHNTDGLWSAIPANIPLEIVMEGKDESGKIKKIKVNLFNSIVNSDVKRKFTNHNNYEWDDESGSYVNVPQCYIKFDYDGPYSTYFVQRKKRYTAYERERYDPSSQKIAEVKGMDRKRKGELPLLKNIEHIVDKSYREGMTYNEVYGNCIKPIEMLVNQINSKTLPPSMIFESRDVKDVSSAKKAYAVVRGLELKGVYDPSVTPMCYKLMKEAIKDKKALRSLKKVMGSKVKSINNRQATGCMRMIDLGINVEDGETVRWIMSRYPKAVDAKSPRVIPTILFDADNNAFRKYLKRWIGYDVRDGMSKEEVMVDILDWDYYLERLAKKVFNIVINPYEHQKDYVKNPAVHQKMKLLKIKTGLKLKKRKKNRSLMQFTDDEGKKKSKKERNAKSIKVRVIAKKAKKKVDLTKFM